MDSRVQQAIAFLAVWRAKRTPRGLRSGRVLHDVNMTTREIQQMAHGTQLAEDVHPFTSVKPKWKGIACWKSEGLVVAMKSSNSDGAKGFWFRIAKQRNKDRTPCRNKP